MSSEIFRDFVKRHPSLFKRLTEGLELMWDAKVPNAPHHRAAIDMKALTDLGNDFGLNISIAPSPSESKKSKSETLKLRERGNNAFVTQSYHKALEYYTQSIAFAPDRSEELALAYGNRSAVLYHLEKYELSILDVNRALKGHFPDRSKRKLIERRKNSLAKLEERNKIKSTFVEAKNLILPNESLDRFNPIERKMCYINNMNIRDSDLSIDYSSLDDPIWNTKFDNALLPNVSPKVKFECNSQWGRHWVANDDISAGEMLAIEDFFALVMKRPMWYEHCSYCSIVCEALIPCPSCTLQMYCSQVCLQEAYNSYHRTECELLPSVTFVDDYTLALRMFIVGTKQGSELTNLMNNPNVYLSLEGKRNCVGVHYPSDYLSILNLAWKIDDMDDEFLIRNLTYMINALRRANFFGGAKKSCKFTDVELFVALLLCHHSTIVRQYFGNLEIELIPSTAVSPVEKKHIGSGESSAVPISEMKLAGSAVSPFGNFLNHSCHANAVAISNKRRQLFYSIKPIEAGEQIFISYLLLSYSSHPRNSREDILPQQCYTVCKCLACVQNWPTLSESTNTRNNYLTNNQMIIEKIEKMQEWLNKQLLRTHLSGSDLWKFKPDDLRRAFEFRNYIRKYVGEPSPSISLCEKFIQKCMETKANIHLTLSTEEMIKYFNPQ